ncbi:aldehyde dehydrogenase family protein [Chitinimonas arctica]|uniref:Aldehyde dehydrogenase family protein n=1 Tax=Chitinimonas arctica TaxID=2594795 RepID=A0A516SCE3_9NEIS|nr:aldehyde dehydrogenase family protein [Chitinimonas arctica]QDQ25815.1 aldehyde dehydrogenase family protein [Chitinimonas arctica]
MAAELITLSPIDGSVLVRRPYADEQQIQSALRRAKAAQLAWRELALSERGALLERGVAAFVAQKAEIAEELTRQMGRPLRYTPGEVAGFEVRARHMIGLAEQALQPVVPTALPGFTRFIRRDPVGLVLVIAPWNYPLLTAVNAVVPALMAGNAVILKHSAQTPLAAERMVAAFAGLGLPEGLLQFIHTDHDGTRRMIRSEEVDAVCFTGSVAGGVAVEQAAAGRFIGVGLELGGNDPAYVRADASLDAAVEGLVDGAFFNSGQSCCGIQRIYVHQSRHAEFVERAVALTRQYVLGNPLEAAVTLGPLVRPAAAEAVRAVIAEARAKGARALIDAREFEWDQPGSAYLAPQILVDVDHGMQVMKEECFGPLVGIMPVSGDQEALRLMNDSPYGLSAAIYTEDAQAALALGERLETGTVFMNRCDYLDPALAWTGVKQTGRGATLSSIGYEHLTRPKSFHLKLPSAG